MITRDLTDTTNVMNSLKRISLILDGDFGKSVTVRLNNHRTYKGILLDASKTELKLQAISFWKKTTIVLIRRYVVSVEFME